MDLLCGDRPDFSGGASLLPLSYRSANQPSQRTAASRSTFMASQIPDAQRRHGSRIVCPNRAHRSSFSLLVPALREQLAGLAMGGATAAAIGGRTIVGWLMPAGADRRLVASASYGIQIIGSIVSL